jgi:hypothetical protein
MPQPAASNALLRAKKFVNVPTLIVFHAGTSTADLIGICDPSERACWSFR